MCKHCETIDFFQSSENCLYYESEFTDFGEAYLVKDCNNHKWNFIVEYHKKVYWDYFIEDDMKCCPWCERELEGA